MLHHIRWCRDWKSRVNPAQEFGIQYQLLMHLMHAVLYISDVTVEVHINIYVIQGDHKAHCNSVQLSSTLGSLTHTANSTASVSYMHITHR